MKPATPPCIELDDRGIAYVNGTGIKVIQVVVDKLAHGWDADQIFEAYDTLSLAEIHAAFAYYHANQELVNRQIEEMDREVERMRAETPVPPLVERLRREGRIR